ncbi:MAG: hypothetical protein ACLQDY_27005 [Streptosporangiaceae bacterium]
MTSAQPATLIIARYRQRVADDRDDVDCRKPAKQIRKHPNSHQN